MKHFLLFIFCLPLLLHAQDDLLNEIDTDSTINQYADAAFKGLQIVNFQSTKLVADDTFVLVVAHRFGNLKNGIDTFFGLDEAVTRLNFIYGISDNLNIGISRSSFQKIYEGSIKYRIVKQSSNGFPLTIVGFNAVLVNTSFEKESFPLIEFSDRLGYTSQILISRKVNTNLSLEFAPTLFHEGLVSVNEQDNTQFALGFGGRYKLTKRWSLNIDYGLHLNRAENSPFKNPLSIGFDLETGGHVFQLHFTNAQGMNTNSFLGQTTGDWTDGDVFFGFNLSRTF
ncbi:DUF5777 family beta-barrel protein [Hyunsoonleella sp. 2307UL5-6]|uniref:DUF5777 family beta-barrel protein n=1 Tax=Hyunsoonleella sp. 2307UL5-6 TaxID=3384768 RepID=UPI0039BCD5A8